MAIDEAESISRCFLVGLEIVGSPQDLDVDASLEELGLLADTAGLHVVGQTSQRVKQPDPKTFIRSGKVDEIRDWLVELDAHVVIFDDELSPRHQRELEKIFGDEVRIVDRTALILDIFAQHAHTREGALQVALAQYEYRLPRLTKQWTHLIRQAGGTAARGGAGGVGLRGPGETQLETDRRDIRRRIMHLQREIEAVRAHRERHRAQRRRQGMSLVTLVGYTNAGKSTLLNRLSSASIHVADQLFATLDPTTRRVNLPSGQTTLMTDTVGFIQRLPHTLVAAFRATLEEIAETDILLHVVDASHPNALQQIKVVERTLMADLGITDVPIVVALNKVDLLDLSEGSRILCAMQDRYPAAIPISALNGTGIENLLRAIEVVLERNLVRVVVRIPYSQGALIARFHELARVETETHDEEGVQLTGVLARPFVSEYDAYCVR